MQVAIIADPHSNYEALQAVLEAIDKRQPERVLCLGDVTGYNASPNKVIDALRERRIPTLMGNHDAAVCGIEDPWFFRSVAQKAVLYNQEKLRDDNRDWLRKAPEDVAFIGKTCLGVHGSPASRDQYIVDRIDAMQQLEFIPAPTIRVVFFGHSHRASFFSEYGGNTESGAFEGVVKLKANDRSFINPGAVGQPRDGDPRAAFGFFDSEALTFEFCRVEYDIDRCIHRILKAHLPKDLAKRLKKGK